MIICAGVQAYLTGLGEIDMGEIDNGQVQHVTSVDEAIEAGLLKNAGAFVLGPDITTPVKEIQKIFAADKHLAVLLFVQPAQMRQVKRAVQFSPFVGSNTLVVALNPELDLESVCRAAIARTQQKRSFQKLNQQSEGMTAPAARVKLAQMGTFLEYAPIGAILLDEVEHIANYNRQAKKLFPALEFLGVPLTRVFSKEQTERISSFIRSDHEPEDRTEIRVRQKIIELTSTVVYGDSEHKHFLLLLLDVTHERMQAARIQSILESLPQMAWTTDAEGLVNYYTQGWYFYTGQTKEEAQGIGWTAVIHDDDIARLAEQWTISLKNGMPLQQTARYRNFKGDYRWHLTKATPIRDNAGQITMWAGTCTDIHDQVMLTEELERKVKERTHSLEASNRELEQYAHIASHDLQEPLRKIQTFAELLRRRVPETAGEEVNGYVSKITSTATRMRELLTALLNYTTLKTEVQIEAVDLNEEVARVLTDLELIAKQKSAAITTGLLPVINGIPVQIQQLFYNLINNALKFSRVDVPPQIDISARQLLSEELLQHPQLSRVKDYWKITVSDNGIGFDQNYADKIFGMFQRLHSKTEFEGTGIGLSLVKRIVDNHGGEIAVSSQPGVGTAFFIILPA